jgi:hypothetical protein
MSAMFDKFNNSSFVQGTKNFLSGNNIVAKFVFIIFVVFIFVILLRLGNWILSLIFTWNPNPILLNGMMSGTTLVKFPQDPNSHGAIPILRSKDARGGLVFTWSTWLWLESPEVPRHGCKDCPPESANVFHHIFSKGSSNIPKGGNGMAEPNNAPGLYISDDHKNLAVIMTTFDSPVNEILIGNIPLNKWMNVIIRVEQHRVDVFINGRLSRSKVVTGVPAQNYDPVYVGLHGGFSGKISSLRYFSHAIGAGEIQQIIEDGPNLNNLDKDISDDKANYLSFRWFLPSFGVGQKPDAPP